MTMIPLKHSFRPASLGAAALTVALLAANAWADDGPVKAGVSAAVRGNIQLVAVKQPVAHKVGSGEAIFLGDHVISASDSGMQILLVDETIFTIGPDSDMSIDTFVYDPSTGAGKLAASVTKGAFRFVSGKIAANNPDGMEIKTPAATISIRGTMVAGRTDGKSVLIVLLGPGYDGDTSEKIGHVIVSNHAGTTELFGAGYGTFVPGPNDPPGTPKLISLDDILRLDLATGGVRSAGSNGGSVQGGQSSSMSGESTAATASSINTVLSISSTSTSTFHTIQTSTTPPTKTGCVPHGGVSC
jgi:FecR protein